MEDHEKTLSMNTVVGQIILLLLMRMKKATLQVVLLRQL